MRSKAPRRVILPQTARRSDFALILPKRSSRAARRRRRAIRPPANRRAPAAAADSAAAEIRQTQIGADGHRRAARARRRQLCRLLHAGRTLLRLHRRRLCARQQHHARRPGVRPHRGNPSRRQHAGAGRRRGLPDRRRRLSHRSRRRAHQDRDPAGHHRSHRPSGDGAGKRGRAGQGAVGFGRRRLEAGGPRLRPPAGAEHQGICLARDVRGLGSRTRPGRGGGEGGAGGL